MPTELTVLRVLPTHIDASCYNDARLALLRLGSPLRLQLPGLRGIDFILAPQRWQCVDSLHGDLVVFAYSEFARAESTALHLPVACRLQIYHIHAGTLLRTALDGLAAALQARRLQHEERQPGVSRVTQIVAPPS